MSAAPEYRLYTPEYRLYTSEEAAARVGGGISEHTFRRLAAARVVESTDAGHKLRWTDAQIAGVVAFLARGGEQPASSPTRAPRPARSTTAQPGAVSPLRPKRGGRYAT